ncbi:MAG: EfeM/EfeO family lipoprotein [Actinobacteria bacterium]|jgi:iron uptake system component EfeO|nr:EfeM/EfeO family lipoprotein [Actinomycetota bacterium]
MRTRATTVLLAPLLVVALGACTQAKSAGGSAITVDASDDACTMSTSTTTTGDREFRITNTGTKVTEFYVLTEDGMVVSEVENLTPGMTRSLHVTLKRPGAYKGNCKPGMVGDGIDAALAVTGDTITTDTDPKLEAAAGEYQAWVSAQADELLIRTAEFVAAVKAKDVAQAKSLYAVARAPWERIEPVAESFGDLDPAIDGREDVIAEGLEFTGFHRLEKDLWVDGLQADSDAIADRLLADVTTIVEKSKAADLDGLKIANGAKELLDEMATGKITGEEDRYSHTDLHDFAANWEGSKKGMEVLKPILTDRNQDLVADYNQAATTLDGLIAAQREGEGYRLYTDVPQAEIKALSDALTAVGEQVGRVGAALATQ